MNKRYLVIADIHANYQALQKLTDLDVMTDEDLSIIFIGDYLDGITLSENATIKTLEFIKELQKNRKNVHVLLGNHDTPIGKIFKNEKLNKKIYNQVFNWIFHIGGLSTLNNIDNKFKENNLHLLSEPNYKNLQSIYQDKTIISGHTPVQTLSFGNASGEPVNLINPNSRVIDGGSNSKKEIDTTHINASLFTKKGQLIKKFKLSSKEQD